jgi:hypothetical protein
VHSYIALAGKATFSGSLAQCITWSREQLQAHPGPSKILKARAGERFACVVAEIAVDGERLIRDGRTVKIRKLRL